MARVCSDECSSKSFQLIEKVKEASEEQKNFMIDVNQRMCHFNQEGEQKTTEDANKSYINRHYPRIEANCNCWPIVFNYQSPEKTVEQLQREDNSKAKKKNYGGNVNKRHADTAEHKVVNMFQTMFLKNHIPSFLISGYKWQGHFMKCMKDGKDNVKKFMSLHPKAGEMDLMIAIPRRCILLVEVKASGAAEAGVTDALRQCARHLDIFSTVLGDVSTESYIPVISVAALPNVQRATVEDKYPECCLPHIVTREDLTKGELYNWYQKLISKYSNKIGGSGFSDDIFRTLIERLVGLSSVGQFKTIPEVIQGTVATMNSMCYQLPPDQVYNLDEKFVWIRGVPGSGKTLLGLSKADRIINCALQDAGMGSRDRHVLYIINGAPLASGHSCLMQFYKNNFGDGNDSCTVYVKESHEMENDIAAFQIPQLIGRLQSDHNDKIIHILLEECQIKFKDVDRDDFQKKFQDSVDESRLGNVWIIQNSFAAKGDSIDPSPDFKLIKLNNVMRMSLENIKFVNAVLDETYQTDHAIAGKRPVIYRMSCICNTESEDKYHCTKCYHIRIVWLLRTAMKDLRLDTSMAICVRNAFITSFTEKQLTNFGRYYDAHSSPLSYNKLPEKLSPALYLASSIHHFTGCERSHVFVEFDCILQDEFSAMESLTRAVGQMVLLDGGYCRKANADNYYEKIGRARNAEDVCDIKYLEEIPIQAAKEAYKSYCAVKKIEEQQEAKIPPLGGATGQSSRGQAKQYSQMSSTISTGQAKFDMQMNERIENFSRESSEEGDEDHLDVTTSNSVESKMAVKKNAERISLLEKRIELMESKKTERVTDEPV